MKILGGCLSRPEELKAERRHYLDLIEGQTRHR